VERDRRRTMNHLRPLRSLFLYAAVLLLARSASAANPFVGEWALTIPGGGAGWLGVTEKEGKLSASVLWGGGSVLPATGVRLEGDTLILTRPGTGRGNT